MKRHQLLNLSNTRFDQPPAISGVALLTIAIGLSGSLSSCPALAETNPTAAAAAKEIPVLPALHVAAAADITANDAVPHMRGQRMGAHATHPAVDKNLTNDQIREIVAGHIAMTGNPNIKVGKVVAKATAWSPSRLSPNPALS